MPIGDLLAQISGDKPNLSSASALQRTNPVPTKRKYEDEFRENTSRKAPSEGSSVSCPGPIKPDSRRPQYNGTAKPNDALGSNSAGLAPKKANPASARRPDSSTPPIAPRRPPKKGSFAEILARGQRAQAVMGQVGKIQHKKVEKGIVKKTRDDSSVPIPSKDKAAGKAVGGYAGTAKPGQGNGPTNGRKSPVKRPRQNATPTQPLSLGREKATVSGEEMASKKIRKSAHTTSGYAGTARPKINSSPRKKDVPRGGALLNVARHSSSKNARFEDDYDEELNDFIEYDEEEEESGPRRGYASDCSSDMEAGLEDIDLEERRAESIGIREDQEEDRLLKSHKAAKEERKRQALKNLRARKH